MNLNSNGEQGLAQRREGAEWMESAMLPNHVHYTGFINLETTGYDKKLTRLAQWKSARLLIVWSWVRSPHRVFLFEFR
jgi:hypothetical protein